MKHNLYLIEFENGVNYFGDVVNMERLEIPAFNMLQALQVFLTMYEDNEIISCRKV